MEAPKMNEYYLSKCDISFTDYTVRIYTPSKAMAVALRRLRQELALWAIQFRKEATEIFFPGCDNKPYRIFTCFACPNSRLSPLQLIKYKVMSQTQPQIVTPLIFTAPIITAWSQSLVDAFNRMIQSDTPMGMNLLETEQQIWINKAAAKRFKLTEKHTQLKRADYWYPEDLELARQTFRDAGDAPFILQYRAKHLNGWALFTNEYQIVDNRFSLGVTYDAPQLIETPASIAV
jgi:hypothetical protein